LAKKLVENLLLAPDEVTSWATLRTAEQLCLRVNQWRTNTRRLGDADHAQDRLSRYTAREKFSGIIHAGREKILELQIAREKTFGVYSVDLFSLPSLIFDGLGVGGEGRSRVSADFR